MNSGREGGGLSFPKKRKGCHQPATPPLPHRDLTPSIPKHLQSPDYHSNVCMVCIMYSIFLDLYNTAICKDGNVK